jgi:Ca2+-binding RTX toxin-like protein
MFGSDSANALNGAAGDDWLRGKGGSDLLTGGTGADTFAWLKKDTADGVIDHVTDFTVGEDKLDLSDFLKGQHVKGGVQYDDVIQIVDSADHTGALVQGRVDGAWHDIAILDGHDAASMNLHDLGL